MALQINHTELQQTGPQTCYVGEVRRCTFQLAPVRHATCIPSTAYVCGDCTTVFAYHAEGIPNQYLRRLLF